MLLTSGGFGADSAIEAAPLQTRALLCFYFQLKWLFPVPAWRATVGSGLSECISIIGLMLLMQFHLMVLFFFCVPFCLSSCFPRFSSLPLLLYSNALSQMGLSGAQNVAKM